MRPLFLMFDDCAALLARYLIPFAFQQPRLGGLLSPHYDPPGFILDSDGTLYELTEEDRRLLAAPASHHIGG